MEPAKADREYPLGEIIIKTGKESQKHMVDTRTDELYRALQDKGYPDELCREIAYKHMNTDYTATRMLGYLYRVDVYKRQSLGRSTIPLPVMFM